MQHTAVVQLVSKLSDDLTPKTYMRDLKTLRAQSYNTSTHRKLDLHVTYWYLVLVCITPGASTITLIHNIIIGWHVDI